MRVSPAAVTVLVILVALGVSANACMAVPPPASDVPLDASATPVIDETPTPQAAEQAADDAAPSPSPAASAGPSPSPAVASRPAKASPVPSPSAEAMTDLVAVALSKDNRIAEIDPVSGRVVRVVDISRPAGAFALTPDGRIAWVIGPQPSRSSVAVFDVLTGDRREEIRFRETDTPAAVAFSTDGTGAYVAMAGDASTIAFTSSTGKEFGRITLGRQSSGVVLRRQITGISVIRGPNGDELFAAANGSGLVWALDGNSGTVLGEIEVGGGPTTLISDGARQRVYALLDTLNQVVAIDAGTLAITNRLDLPARPIGAVLASDGTLFIVGGDANGELWAIEPGATAIRWRAPIGGRPVGVAISADGKALYVPDAATRSLAILTADTAQMVRTIPLSSDPLAVVSTYPSQLAHSFTPQAAPSTTPASPPRLVATATAVPDTVVPPEQLPAGVNAEPFLSGADTPVAFAFAPDGRLFYDELRSGSVRIVQDGALVPDAFYKFAASALSGIALDPDFAHNHYVYVSYLSADADAPSGAIVRLTDVDNKGTDPTPVMEQLPVGANHAGGALRFGPDGKLYVSVSDGEHASSQDVSTLAGKILRINSDGSVPDDNPFATESGKQGSIWAYGLFNAASVAFHPIGHQLLEFETSANGADELNLISPGGNYGAPASGYLARPGLTDPIAVMNPSIEPTGSTFYIGDQISEWKNDLFYCNAKRAQLRRVRLAAGSFDRVELEETVKQGCAFDVATGPDGALYYSDAAGIYRLRRPSADLLPPVRT